MLINNCNVNARDRRWIEVIREFLEHEPGRRAQFATELDDAIDRGTLSLADYEKMTREDFDTHEDLVAWLKELRGMIFPCA